MEFKSMAEQKRFERLPEKVKDRIRNRKVCPNCDQWQDPGTGDCFHECKARGFVDD